MLLVFVSLFSCGRPEENVHDDDDDRWVFNPGAERGEEGGGGVGGSGGRGGAEWDRFFAPAVEMY